MEMQLIALLGLLSGCLFRGVYPYLVKVSSGEIAKWEHKYTAALLLIAIVSVVESFMLLSAFTMPEGSELIVYGAALVFGYGQQSLLNDLVVNPLKKKS